MISDSKKTILLVEDMAIIAMAEANMLRKNGFDVIVAYNGNEAIKLASESPNLDLILMDIDLGKGMDGTEAAQIILKNHEVPIVFLSNHTEKEVVEKTEKITSYGYVVKNSGETVLIASIKMAFKLFDAHRLRLESENKLLESDRKFHTLEKQIDDVIWTMDMNFRFTYVSPSVEKLHGYTVDEMMKLNLQAYLTPDSTQKVISILGEQISEFISNRNEGTIVTVDIDQVKKDGTIFPTEIRARFLLDNYKNPIGMIGVTRDITERKKSREALVESRKALDLALEGAQIGFWDSNYLTGKVYRSEIWASMLGYTLDEIENSPQFWSDLIHPDDLERVLAEVRKHEAGECEHFNIEHRIRTKSGDYKWILDWGKVFERSESGKPIRAMGVHIDIDKRIAIEQKLLETNNTLNLALEGAQIGLWDQNFKTGIVNRSAHWATMLGYDPAEMKNDLDFWKSNIHPDDKETALNEAEKHEQGLTEFYKVQHRLKCKNGKYKWILNWGKISERDEQGKPVRALGIHLDIDEHRQIQESLKLSEERLRYALEGNSDGIWDWNLKTGAVYFSPHYYTMLGYQPNEFLPSYEKWKEFLHPDDLVKSETTILSAIEMLNSFSVEFRLRKKDGSYCWILSRGKVAEKDSDGKALRISGSHSDINERKLAEEVLKKNENKLNSIFKAAPIGIGVTSNRVLLEVNDTMCKMLGYNCEDLIGKSSLILYPTEEEYDFVGKEKYKQIEQFGTGTVETKWVCKNGKTIDVLLSSTPLNLTDVSGGVTFTALDISERKLAELLLKESAANLAAVINYREEAIWSIDKEYNYIIVNDAFRADYKQAFGVELKKGINAIELLSGELLEFWKPKYDKALSGEVVKFEFSQKILDRVSSFEMTLSPIISDTKVLGVTGISRDISKRKEIEEEILKRKEELERFEKIVVGRELKMIELKDKISELELKLKELT